MNVLYFLVPIALILAACGVAAFRWAVNSGQFDDLESPAIRMLIDDTPMTQSLTTEPHEHEIDP